MHEPTLTRKTATQIDRRASEQFGLPGLVLMENAGRGCADALVELGAAGPIVICCGKGNNAGDGFVMARHLDLRGIETRVLVWAKSSQLTGDAAANFDVLGKCEIPIEIFGARHDAARFDEQLRDAEWIVDALLGTGVRGQPRAPLDAVIASINAHPARKLAIDVPSGLDCDTGRPASQTVRADWTFTLVAAKAGFRDERAKPFLGQVRILPIGAPRILVEQVLAEGETRAE